MRAVVVERFGSALSLREVAAPVCPPDGVVVRVEACGICRSDWHAWQGHDSSVTAPYVPGHEWAGEVVEVGTEVTGWVGGERVTAPFVQACGRCAQCRERDHQVCADQRQPGFTHDGAFAELVVAHRADVNLVRLPDGMDAVTAASLGCRFATAYRAVAGHGGVRPVAQSGVHVLAAQPRLEVLHRLAAIPPRGIPYDARQWLGPQRRDGRTVRQPNPYGHARRDQSQEEPGSIGPGRKPGVAASKATKASRRSRPQTPRKPADW